MSNLMCGRCGYKITVNEQIFPNDEEDIKKINSFIRHLNEGCDVK